MKKSFKRIFAIVIATMMIALMVPFSASADNSADNSEKVPTLIITSSVPNFRFKVYKLATIKNNGEVSTSDNGEEIDNLVKAEGSDKNTQDLIKNCDDAYDNNTLLNGLVETSVEGAYQYEGAGVYYIKPVYTGNGKPLVATSVIRVLKPNTDGETFSFDNTKLNEGNATIDKKITAVNGVETRALKNGEVATAQLGDQVNYKLEAVVPCSESKPITQYVLNDTYEKGLGNLANVKVYLDGTKLDEDYYTLDDQSDSKKFSVTINGNAFGDDYFKNHNSAKVNVTFTLTINEEATKGTKSNDNSVTLTYQNKDDSKSTTLPGPTVQVFCFGLQLNKVDGKSNPLQGAVFSLSDRNLSKTATSDAKGVVLFDEFPLAAGLKYTVTEISAPSGYILEGFSVEVTLPELDVEQDGTDTETESPKYKLTALSLDDWSFSADTGIFTRTQKVVNPAITVPETGGVGTWMFTLGGAALIVLAGAMFIVLKKKKTSK